MSARCPHGESFDECPDCEHERLTIDMAAEDDDLVLYADDAYRTYRTGDA